MKIIFVVNEATFFLSHRLPLAREAQRLGYAVIVACGEGTGESKLAEAGLEYRVLPLSRSGFNPIEEFATWRALLALYRQERPDLVHHITIKPVLYGTSAARWQAVRAVVNAVPGMGFVFTRRGVLAAARRAFVNLLYRLSLSHPNMRVIFQNSEDLRGFVDSGIVKRSRTALIRGSGVDLERFRAVPEPEGPVTFLLVARMLRHKGVQEFVGAARIVRQRHPQWRFVLAGDVDPGNPASLTREQLSYWHELGTVEWLGQREDVAELMSLAHVVCLPSYYREGVPKTLLEASACARPMITCDIAGCREVVRDGVTGLLVAPRDPLPIAAAAERLGADPELRRRMGKAALERARALFSVDDVVRDTFLVYQALLPA